MVGFALLAFGGVPYVLWGIFFRTTFGLHCTWLVNSATHLWGSRRFATRDDSTNNWWVALLSFGEGWHNNHHAHPTSARHGLAWYEFDFNWIGISTLRAARPRLGHQGGQDQAAGALRGERYAGARPTKTIACDARRSGGVIVAGTAGRAVNGPALAPGHLGPARTLAAGIR